LDKDIRVIDILNNPQFTDFKVLAGEKGLHKAVKSITIMDAPDPFKWAKGGEIVLTSGYIFFINKDKFCDILTNLHKSGIAALFIKLKRFFDRLPDDVIELANELQFPIVEVPMHFAFIEVINPTLLQIISHQSKRLKFSEEIHKTFTNLVINNEDTQTIVNTLSDILNEDILYYDFHFQKSYYSKNSVPISKEITGKELKQLLETHQYYTIGLNEEIYGYIIYLNKKSFEFSDDDYNILTHANTALILDVQKKISSMQIENRHRNEFVLDLIMNNIKYEDEVKNRSSIFGWDFTDDICVMVVDIDNFKEKYLKPESKKVNNNLENVRERIFKYTMYILKSYLKDVIYATFSDSIVFLLQPDGKDAKMFELQLKRISDEIRDTIVKNFEFTVMVGVGRLKDNVMDIHKSYNEAVASIKIGRIIYKKNATVFYKDLGVYRLLHSIYKDEDALEFYTSSLGKIIEHDEKYNSELLETLKCIIENDWNLKNTADAMFLHYNTVKYRYKKICELLDEDLSEHKNRLNISLALIIHQMIE